MAVNYNAGASSALASQYADLRNAIASRDAAENLRRAEDIDRQGLFGTGIRTSDIQDLGNLAIKGAEFGDARMARKMDRARASFERRMKADERRLKTLQRRVDAGLDPEGTDAGEIKKLQFGMGERRNSFEDYMEEYEKKGLFGTSFGGDEVGYRTEGESRYSQALRGDKPGSGDGSGSTQGADSVPGFSENPNERRLQQEIGFSENPNERRLQQEIGFSENPNERRGIMNLGGGEEDRFGIANPRLGGEEKRFGIGGKKKADLGDSVAPTSGQELRDIASGKDTAHMRAQQDPTAWRSNFNTEESNKFTGGPPRRDNYRMALPYALAQANLSAEERAARDAAEKQELIKEKYLVDQNKQKYQDQVREVLAKRKRNKIEDLVSNLNIGG